MPLRLACQTLLATLTIVLTFIGLEHVDLDSDLDGRGGVEAWNDTSKIFNVTIELVRRGYTEDEIGMLCSGNLLRVLDDMQRVISEIQENA